MAEPSETPTTICCEHPCSHNITKFNLVLVGAPKVGKKTYIARQLTGEFDVSAGSSKILQNCEQQLQFETKNGIVQFNTRIFSSLKKKPLPTFVDCAIVMFDGRNDSSSHNIESWEKGLHRRYPGIPIVACGTKSDLGYCKGKIKRHIYPAYPTIPYYQISAKVGLECMGAFQWLATNLMKDESVNLLNCKHVDWRFEWISRDDEELRYGEVIDNDDEAFPQTQPASKSLENDFSHLDLHGMGEKLTVRSEASSSEIILTPDSTPSQRPYDLDTAQSSPEAKFTEPKLRKLFIVCIHCTRMILIQTTTSTPNLKALGYFSGNQPLLAASACKACVFGLEADDIERSCGVFGFDGDKLLNKVKISDYFFRHSDMWHTLVRIGGEDLTTLIVAGNYIRYVNLGDLADELTSTCRVQSINPQAIRSRDLPEEQLLLPYVLGDFLY